MRRWIAPAALLALTLLPDIVLCEGPQPTLISRQEWVRFEIVLGRLRAVYLQNGSGRVSHEDGDVAESLTMTGTGTRRVLRYERRDSTSHTELQFAGSGNISFARKFFDLSNGPTTTFLQRPQRPVQLLVGEADNAPNLQFESIWHLMLLQPDVAEQHLLPFLELLRPDWQLDALAHRVEVKLLEAAGGNGTVTRQQVESLIRELGNRHFSVRRKADRKLRSLGVAALPYVRSRSMGQLSQEQRLRLQQIEEHLCGSTADTPVRVGAWLAHDESIWVALLSHHDPAKRHAAEAHLTAMRGDTGDLGVR